MAGLDWSALHAFAEVAHCGSVLRAARALGLTQPTVSRQIAALEARLGYPLFQRSPRGMRLNARGQALLAPIERMRQESHALARLAQAQQEHVAGNVRISASEIVSAYMLPAMLDEIRQRHPQLDFTIVASNQLSNLVEREADIAVRMLRPRQAGLVTRHVGDFRVVMAAHRRYLQKAGVPRDASRLFDWQMIGFDRDRSLERAFAAHGIPPSAQRWSYRCDSHAVCWQLVRQGMGIGFVTDRVADREPDIVRVLPQLPTPYLPVWLTMHRDMRASARLRLVFDALAQAFEGLTGRAPEPAARPLESPRKRAARAA